MQIIRKGNDFHVIFKYNPLIIDRLKRAVPGRRYDNVNKCWVVPGKSESALMKFARDNHFVIGEVNQEPERVFEIPPMPDLDFEIKSKLTPFPYQLQGIAYILNQKRVIVGDQMGLGKTGQTILALAHAKAFPALIVCPSTLKENWVREWEKWTNYKAIILSDKIKSNFHLYWQSNMAQVFVVNYESLKKYFVEKIEIPQGQKLRINHITFKEKINMFKSVVFDESHKIKDGKTQQTKFSIGIARNKEWAICITGTPVINKPKDLIAPLHCIGQLQTVFGGYSNFTKRYCAGDREASNLRELGSVLRSNCFYRREKTEVLKDLPPKTRQVVICEIDPRHRKEYNHAEADLVKYLKEYKEATDAQIRKSMRGEVMVRIGILKNISARGKLLDVYDFIRDTMESGEKLVVFAHLKEVIQKIRDEFPHSVAITGDTSMTDRQSNVDRFQSQADCKLIVCSTKAAGVGLTLTASSMVAFVELPWTFADCEQAEDRCILEGQMIMTPKGWQPVETIKKGDEVINRYGAPEAVTDVWSRRCQKTITTVTIEGYGDFTTTSDHKYLSPNLVDWYEAADLRPGERVVLFDPSQMSDSDLTHIEFDTDCRVADLFTNNHGITQTNGRLKHAPKHIEITDDFLFTCGYFAGDGFASTSNNKGRFISFAAHVDKKATALNVCRKWLDDNGINHSTKQSDGYGCEVRGYSAEWAFWFRKHFGHFASNKHLPDFAMELNQIQSAVVLSGLMASDGYYRKGRYEYITASNQLASQVFRLILRSGFRPTINKNSTGQFVVAYAEKQQDNTALILRVTTQFAKRTGGIKPMVYDITTEKTSSFVAGISVVHNCHRIGQTDNVTAYYFLGRDTIDGHIYDIIQTKKDISRTVTGAEDDIPVNVIDAIADLFTQPKE